MLDRDKYILTVNSGSSSLKIDIFKIDAEKIYSTSLTNIGEAKSIFTVLRYGQKAHTEEPIIENHEAAIRYYVDWLTSNSLLTGVVGVGHRVVHGGPHYAAPQIVTEQLLEYLRSLSDYDPEHMPAALGLMQSLGQLMPHITQVACFDTAFFYQLPRVAQLTSLPKEYQKEGLRRYGFHGLSYTFLQQNFTDIAGETAAAGKVIYAHLGSGASLAATINKKPIDTTMSFSPASGIIMSSRSGDIDPGLFLYLQRKHKIDTERFNRMVNFESGLKGVSGLTADMYTLLQNRQTNPDANDAITLFVHQIKKTIGSFVAEMDGLNSLIFSGGIGEKSSLLRAEICENLKFFGIEIDHSRNENNEFLISSDSSTVGVHVIPTDESRTIFNQLTELLVTNQQFVKE